MNTAVATENESASGLVRKVVVSYEVELVPLDTLTPAAFNDLAYKPVRLDDPAIQELGADIRRRGQLLEPIVVSLDNVIVSGHRRRGGCLVARMHMVPVRRANILSTDPRFEEYVIAFNQQRVKTTAEQIREEVVRTSPDDAHNALLAHRKVEEARQYKRVRDSGLRVLTPTAAAARSVITGAKRPMLDAALAVVGQYKNYWPLTLRQIHYRLLTRHVFRNADHGETYTRRRGGKVETVDNVYRNTEQCYKDLSDLLSRARVVGEFPWESMHDPTRPQTAWRQWDSVAPYAREELDEFLAGYKRNLLQSQSAYVELVVEKLTVHDIAKRAAGYFHVPVGVGRGYTSTTALSETADRFHASGKDQFILLIAGDLDPEGENIPETWGGCLRDEHGVENLTVVKVGVNPDQVARYGLSPLPVKDTSSRAVDFAAVHGTSVYELEAFEPSTLQEIIRDAIRGVLDMNLFADQQRRESEDARHLMVIRNRARELFADCLPD